jgi:hypothetical protein
LWVAIIFAATGTGRAQCPNWGANADAFSLTINQVRDTVTAGSRVLVNAVLTNKSNQDICMLDEIGYMYAADVRDAEGHPAPETKAGFYHDLRTDLSGVLGDRMDGRYLRGSLLSSTLSPSQSEIGEVNVSRLYDLDQPGTYTIVLSLTGSKHVKSNPVTVTVLPAPAVASSPATKQTSASPSFSLDIKADESVRRGLAVDLYVVTKNTSTHSIVVRRQERPQDTGLLGPVLRVDVSDRQGAPSADVQLGRSINHSADAPPDPASMKAARAAGTVVSLKPGEDWQNSIRVSDLYDLSKPDQYTIQVRRWDDETKTWVKSNTITVTVTP